MSNLIVSGFASLNQNNNQDLLRLELNKNHISLSLQTNDQTKDAEQLIKEHIAHKTDKILPIEGIPTLSKIKDVKYK